MMQAAFGQTKLGQVVEQMFQSSEEAAARFLFDLISLKIGNIMSERAKELLCHDVLKAAKASKMENIRERLQDELDDFEVVNDDSPLSAVDIYKTIMSIKSRLQLTAALFKSVAKLEEKLDAFNEETAHFTLDIRAVIVALEMLEPDPKKLLNDDFRKEWGSKVMSMATYLKQLDGLVSRGNGSEDLKNKLSKAWKRCQRAGLVKLYFDHVMQNNVDPEIKKSVCDTFKFFWIGLKEMDFSSSSKTFKAILKSIEKCCSKAGDVFDDFKGIQECVVCQEAIAEPVVLTCGHVGCKRCLKNHFESREKRVCPFEGCKVILPDDFPFECLVRAEEAVQKHSEFRAKLSQFFLDVLQRFVFVKEKPPHQDIVDTLLSFIVTRSLPKDESIPRTKNLSPFRGDYIDPKPVIRSFVLQLLFRYDIETIETHLEKFMNQKQPFVETDTQFQDLCIMIVQCLEDSFLAEERKTSKGKVHQINSSVRHMRSRIEKEDEASLVKSLRNTALDRLAINNVALAINSLLTKEADETSVGDLLTTAVQFVDQHPEGANLQKYLVRYIVAKYQLEAVVEWKKKGFYVELLPETMRISEDNESPDMFLLIDEDYKKVRNSLIVAWVGEDYEHLTSLVDEFQDFPMLWSLALHHLTKVNPCQIRNPEAFEEFLYQNQWLAEIWKQTQESGVPSLTGKDKNHRHASVNNLLTHFKAVLAQNQMGQLLRIFKQLSQTPANCTQTFLPTMPHDEALEVLKALKESKENEVTTVFKCENGHPYVIGECGRPYYTAKCNECNAPIGGVKYNVFVGTGLTMEATAQAALTDGTKPGHVLGPAVVGTRSTTVRKTGGLEVALIRFLLHLAMTEGWRDHAEDVAALIDPHLQEDELVGEFLADHLLLNLRQISDCLGKSENDAIVLLHHIIKSFSEVEQAEGEGDLTSKDSVKIWENVFVQNYIQPALADLDEAVTEHQNLVKEDSEESTNELQDIIFQKYGTIDDRAKILSLPQFWIPRENITIERIEPKVGGAEKLKEKCPFLAHLLNEEPVLEQLVHLPRLIELTSFLVKNFNRQFDAVEANQMSIAEFVNQHMDPNDRKYTKPLIALFLSVLTKLRLQLSRFKW